MNARARSLLAWLQGSTAARKRALIGLIALPLAVAAVAGTALGVVAERGDWGGIAIAISIPVALLVAAITARTLLAAAQSVRRTHSALWMVDKLAPIHLTVREDVPRRVNIVHPAIDLKHFFGGFIAVFNLARRLGERGHQVRLIALEESRLPTDWRARLAQYEGIGDSVHQLEVAFAADRTRPIEASPEDALIATHWTAAHVAAAALPHLRAERFLYLIQEYEPFIFPMGSAAALARGSYELPHTALFSTDLLRDWFAARGIGVFAAGQAADKGNSLSFDNAITPVGPVRTEDLRRPGPRRLLFYARPEQHASRNLFEVGAMALDQAIAAGRFAGWELSGVGTVELRGGSLPLPRSGASLRLVPRGPQADYGRLLRSFDVGLALMYTPHPGLVAIEMAAAGMPTVTNTFENKDAAALGHISPNLVAAEPSVEGVAAALTVAEGRSERLDQRARGSRVAWPASWDDALNDDLVANIDRLLAINR
jgi:beta-1,2-rhamnosyltransferase WsaF-like protein